MPRWNAKGVALTSWTMALMLLGVQGVSWGALQAPGAATSVGPEVGQSDLIPGVRLVRVLPELNLIRPTQVVAHPTKPSILLVLEQSGRVLQLEASGAATEEAAVFLDLRDRVHFGGNEEGLLSMVFHPNWKQDNRLYVFYTAESPRRVVISEFRLEAEGRGVAQASERVIIEVPQPWSNHNGGTLLFGPDGMLYASFGDGGAANDPHGHGQDLGTLLGSVIRIDVDRSDGDRPYAIPPDNPFLDRPGARPEIWAYGLRNVWRMSFDRETGDLWAGDVGQNKYEEINLIIRGGNYGWNRREGFHPFGRESTEPPQDPLLDPVIEYPREEGVSVTGGYVYRGPEASLRGVYLYADYALGTIWGLKRLADGTLIGPKVLERRSGSLISSFGEARDGTLYLTTFEGGERPGRGAIWRVEVEDRGEAASRPASER